MRSPRGPSASGAIGVTIDARGIGSLSGSGQGTVTMGSGHTLRREHIRREADHLEATHGRGRFRRRRTIEQSPRSEQLVVDAAVRAKAGDQDALRFLYLRYADNVYGYVCSIVRDEHDAEDVTQQVFAKLSGALGRYEPRAVPFSAWILRVAHNAAIDFVRARRAAASRTASGSASPSGWSRRA